MTLVPVVFLLAGIGLLVKGADWLVDGASSIARRFGIGDLFIGLTIVAFGTSMPELIVNVVASYQGETAIAIGNVVGSNIANILLILGATSAFTSLSVQSSTVRKEIPFSLLAALMLLVAANDTFLDGSAASMVGRGDGLVFIGFFLVFLYYTFGIAKATAVDSVEDDDKKPFWLSALLAIVGAIALAGGGKLAVDGASSLASALGVSDALIGLTVVAVGTSLPELASSLVAAYRGKADIAVGNAVGSNIFNIFWILGISSIIKPLPFDTAMNFDLIVVAVATVLLLVAVHNGGITRRLFFWWRQKEFRIQRWEGATLLVAYACYVAFIAWRG